MDVKARGVLRLPLDTSTTVRFVVLLVLISVLMPGVWSSWVDVRDVARATAAVVVDPANRLGGQVYALYGMESLSG